MYSSHYPPLIVERDFVPTDGNGLPIFIGGDFGRSPFFGQLSVKQCI
jgi:hypothetical protein